MFVVQLQQCRVIDMICKLSAKNVVPKLHDVVYHAEGFSFRHGVILFSIQESSSSVVNWPTLVWRCPLHESVANSHIRHINKNVEWL